MSNKPVATASAVWNEASRALPHRGQGRFCPVCGSRETHNLLEAPDRFHGRVVRYLLRRCAQCTLVWLAEPPPLEAMSEHYGAQYHVAISGAATASPYRWAEHRQIIERYKSGGSLLDCGCGSGSFLRSLRRENWQLYGIELSQQEAEAAAASTGAEVFAGDIADAPWRDDSLDVVTALDVVEHFHEPKDAVKKIFRWLKPGGILYVSLPNVFSWESRFFGSYWYGLELPRHLFHYSPRSLQQLMRAAGYCELFVETSAVTYIEHSCRYIFDDALRLIGFDRKPLATSHGSQNLLWRITRKGFRVTALSAFAKVARAAGKGASIRGVFQKPA
jgi:2-polyprenyl-3-methyl-5-hydroxy-6-metoxy-1,4-benzoquinol methylase